MQIYLKLYLEDPSRIASHDNDESSERPNQSNAYAMKPPPQDHGGKSNASGKEPPPIANTHSGNLL
ncbi:hypothetical protein M413DRAFT_31711 [Hebeloma cylindrosporum]|uniref:Uncharacterized protein n=1 Tax=Hebeloma cylindrosporum TaxID=76867 RepID=A0A0C2XEW0_HEBCY|nr:hypothetical protein M413DRAFT_31711 [Hebeloma cylindrosporum h7]